MIDRRLAVFVAEGERAAFGALLEEVFAGKAVRDRELTLALDGEIRCTQIATVTVRDDDGPRGLITMLDVTDARIAEEARRGLAHRAEEISRLQSLGVLAGGIAHHFNNLLTVVIAGTDHVLELLPADSALTNPLEESKTAAAAAALLSQQMLAYAGRVSTAARVTDLAALMRELEPQLRVQASTTPIAVEIARQEISVTCDPAQIQQLVHNLVANAVEAMAVRRGSITVKVSCESMSADALQTVGLGGSVPPGPYAVLEVLDEGVGMSPEIRARMFEPYFSTKAAGHGLGLSVVQGIVRGHQGAIVVASEVGGTSVKICLPISGRDPRPLEPPTPLERSRTKATIMVVDDVPEVRRALARVLTHAGFEVTTADNGRAAVELFRADPARFDLVVLDFSMPGMDGLAAGTAIRAMRADVPLVLVTGYGEVPEHGASPFVATVTKPFDNRTLTQLVRRLLA